MEKSIKANIVTAQGVMTPVPAAPGSARAGYQPSISSDCNGTPVSLAGVAQIATSTKTNQEEQSPFGRSSVIRRSPPTRPQTTPQTTSQEAVMRGGEEPQAENTNLSALGKLIEGLADYVKNRNNVHHAIKDQVRSIKVAYNKVCDDWSSGARDGKNTAKFEKTTQTSPKVLPRRETKRSRDVEENSPNKVTTKRPKHPAGRETRNPILEVATEKQSALAKPAEKQSAATKPTGDWVVVRKKVRLRKPKPDAVVISSVKEGVTYADILRKLRSDPNLSKVGEEVNKIRRTQKGDLVLELKSSDGRVAGELNRKIESSLEGSVRVNARISETVIDCKDMDDITTKSEICEAFAKAFNLTSLEESAVRSIRKAYGGTQTAKVSLPTDVAHKAIEMRRIKIGWSVCRIREAATVTKCFRCFQFGHHARFCKAEIDRSNVCRKCGNVGHFSKDCKNEPNCVLCKLKGAMHLNHTAGSYRCPEFRKALSNRSKSSSFN